MRWSMRVGLSGAVACVLLADPLSAQIARGTVKQATAGLPISGALVELIAVDSTPGTGARVASTLSDGNGDFTLRAPSPGRYRLGAKRIGVRRYISDPFTLGAGETRSFPIELEALEYRLPEIVVAANALCSIEPADRARVASLWEEARTALDAAEISLRDRLFTAQVTRYARELEPRTLRVLQEGRSEVRGVVGAPITTLPPESLSTSGYWRAVPGGGALYYVPDPAALLSDDFQGDHCFRPVTGRGVRQGLTGLAFLPSASRNVPDVRGTLWLDARSFELRVVEFSYTRLPDGVDSTSVGGELHFARLANGAWIVRRWFLRVPVTGRPAGPVTTEGSAPWVLVRPATTSLGEEGAEVTTDELRAPVLPATISGVLRDSTGKRALAGAVVRIGGATRTVVPDSAGRFTIDALAPGPIALLATSASYDSLGIAAADLSLELASGEVRRIALTARDARATTMRLCNGEAAPFGHGTVHLVVRDSASGAPLAGAAATLRWMSAAGRAAGDPVAVEKEATSDARGMLAVCAVPSEREATLRVTPATGGAAVTRVLVIRAREVHHVEVRLAPSPPTE